MFYCFHCSLCIVLLLVSHLYVLFSMSSLGHGEPFSFVRKKKFMACTSHVSHPFESVHVLFCCVVLCGKSRNIRRKKSFFSRSFAATQRGQRSYQGTRLLYSNLARIRKHSRAHTQGPKQSTSSFNTNLVCAAQKLLKRKFPATEGLQDTLCVGSNQYAGDFTQILHVDNNHWIVVSTNGCPPSTIRVYDSMLLLAGDVKKLVAKLMRVDTDHIQIDLVDIRPQTNESDCGLYAIANAFELCAKRDPATCNWKEKCMRPHLLKCLENEAITRFPHEAWSNAAGVILTTKTAALHCLCRKASKKRENMARCTKCGLWYHQKCLSIRANVFSAKSKACLT